MEGNKPEEKTMFNTIVVGTDGSPDAERALEVVVELA